MKLYIRGSRGGRNGLYSSELALHERHVGLTEMTICRYSLFLSPKGVLYWLVKGLLFHTNYLLIVSICASFIASPGQSEQQQSEFNIGMYCKPTLLHSNSL